MGWLAQRPDMEPARPAPGLAFAFVAGARPDAQEKFKIHPIRRHFLCAFAIDAPFRPA